MGIDFVKITCVTGIVLFIIYGYDLTRFISTKGNFFYYRPPLTKHDEHVHLKEDIENIRMASSEELMSELIKVSKKVDQLDYIKTKIDEFGKSLEFLNAKYDEQKKEIDRLKIENQNIKAKNVELEKDMNDLEGKNYYRKELKRLSNIQGETM